MGLRALRALTGFTGPAYGTLRATGSTGPWALRARLRDYGLYGPWGPLRESEPWPLWLGSMLYLESMLSEGIKNIASSKAITPPRHKAVMRADRQTRYQNWLHIWQHFRPSFMGSATKFEADELKDLLLWPTWFTPSLTSRWNAVCPFSFDCTMNCDPANLGQCLASQHQSETTEG